MYRTCATMLLYSNSAHYQKVRLYLLSRDWVGLKRCSVLKEWKQLQENHGEEMQNSYTWKPLAILSQNIAPESHDFSSQSRKNQMRKFQFCYSSFFFLSSFFYPIKHNSKCIGCIRMIHTPNESSTIKDLAFLGQSCIQAKTDELWPKTGVMVAFLHAILWVITRVHAQLDN